MYISRKHAQSLQKGAADIGAAPHAIQHQVGHGSFHWEEANEN